ncbi:transposase [Magnetospirillum sp. SS-4]|nr:transposase [Magnetospirillum sp. SS-4]
MAWRSGQSYSQDLRDRVLAAVDSGKSAYEVAPLFQVSVSYIYKAQGRRRATGETTARPRPGRPGQKLAAHLEALQAQIKAEPDATLAELRAWVLAELGVSISIGGLWNTLERLELSLKKRVRMRPNRNGPT